MLESTVRQDGQGHFPQASRRCFAVGCAVAYMEFLHTTLPVERHLSPSNSALQPPVRSTRAMLPAVTGSIQRGDRLTHGNIYAPKLSRDRMDSNQVPIPSFLPSLAICVICRLSLEYWTSLPAVFQSRISDLFRALRRLSIGEIPGRGRAVVPAR